MNYEDVAREIIEKQQNTIGMIAMQKASQVEKIQIDAEEIKFEGEVTREEIESLMKKFKEIQGKGAVGIARKAISSIPEEELNLDLPEEIMPKDIKKDQLADAI